MKVKVGVVKHYYDKIGVAIVQLSSGLSVGDKIRFEKGGEEIFEQVVGSIQVEHEKIDSAKKGGVVGLKVEMGVKEGAEIFKV